MHPTHSSKSAVGSRSSRHHQSAANHGSQTAQTLKMHYHEHPIATAIPAFFRPPVLLLSDSSVACFCRGKDIVDLPPQQISAQWKSDVSAETAQPRPVCLSGWRASLHHRLRPASTNWRSERSSKSSADRTTPRQRPQQRRRLRSVEGRATAAGVHQVHRHRRPRAGGAGIASLERQRHHLDNRRRLGDRTR